MPKLVKLVIDSFEDLVSIYVNDKLIMQQRGELDIDILLLRLGKEFGFEVEVETT